MYALPVTAKSSQPGYRRQSGKNCQQAARGKEEVAGSRRAACNEPVNACIREWMPLLASSHARTQLKWFKKIHSSRGGGEGEAGQEEMLLRQGVLHGNAIALHL